MKSFQLITKRLMATVAVSASFLVGIPYLALAQSNPGLTIFSGVERENILNYHLDFGGRAGSWDRYRLRVPGNKLTEGVSKLYVIYPDYYNGRFDVDRIEVRLNNESLPLRDVIWDQESNFIEIDLEEPLLESRTIEIVMSNVYNPRFGGTFYFQGQMMTAGQIPIRLNLGTWILSIN
ncbi:DUF2808 domain-containing protein [Cyanobacterium stanieri LEGE 03274]|uniref:DUF2808 domain-containing protein n=1 Tax=Cyanobacterium stanieri LEGE 03274 TaxID=1828756 RepID=A0ABR9V4Y8_9CHRO|nr:DUF2808 domain-containing protein [Cyanobacterium stanieri]MBE9222953.1 DUF2808 domain-containing protein [Cyanobacterium stanieri LEGE 03274]